MSGEAKFVRHAGALGGQAVTDGARWGLRVDRVGVLQRGVGDGLELLFEDGDSGLCGCPGRYYGLFDLDRASGYGGDSRSLLLRLAVAGGDVERLRALGVVAVDGYGLEALTPGFQVGFRNVIYGTRPGGG